MQEMLTWLSNLRNRVDFAIRSELTWGRQVKAPLPSDLAFQTEARKFLRLLDWTRIIASRPCRILDVGTRTFALAPVLAELCGEATITGIELDAYRRFSDFTTRRNHGDYWAAQVPNARYIAGDVREFHTPQDVVLLLDPFVSEHPLLAWGLPLHTLAPAEIFAHCCRLTTGVLVLSNPSEDEAGLSDALMHANGMRETQRAMWPRRILRCFEKNGQAKR